MQYSVPPVRIRLTALPELSELLEAFTRAGYLAVQARRDIIEIHRTPSSEDPPADLEAFLRIWNVMHRDAPAEFLNR
jgi:hypothetical protein